MRACESAIAGSAKNAQAKAIRKERNKERVDMAAPNRLACVLEHGSRQEVVKVRSTGLKGVRRIGSYFRGGLLNQGFLDREGGRPVGENRAVPAGLA